MAPDTATNRPDTGAAAEPAKRRPLFSKEYFVFDFVRITAGIPGLIWFRPKKIYESEAAKARIRGGALLVANHLGFFDPVYMMIAIWYRRHRFICGTELMEHKMGSWLKKFRCIAINREDMSFNSLREVVQSLKDGELVSMFPEGHVCTSEKAGEIPDAFKSGMVLMSLKSGKPIIPMYIIPRKHFFSRLKVVVGERISVTELYGPRPKFSQLDEAARLIRDKELQLIEIAKGITEKHSKK